MRKLWSLILIIRRNEMLLRNWYEKKDAKTKSKTVPAVKIQDAQKVRNSCSKIFLFHFFLRYL